MMVPVFDALLARIDGLGMPLAIICLLANGYRRGKQTKEKPGRLAQISTGNLSCEPSRGDPLIGITVNLGSDKFGQRPRTPAAQ